MKGRKGQFIGSVVVAIMLVFVEVAFISAAGFLTHASNQQTAVKGLVIYRLSTNMEKTMNMPCATHERGVFRKEAIENGDFGCMNITGTYLGFNLDPGAGSCFADKTAGACHYMKIESQGTRMNVDTSLSRKEFIDTMEQGEGMPRLTLPVSVYDKDSGETSEALMRMVVTK